MGADKSMLDVGGLPLAVRAARALAVIARPVLAVGGEAGTRLEAVADPGEGPLAAFAAGAEALSARGCAGPVLLVACDLPFVTAELLAHLWRALGDAGAAVPVAGGREQPLAACYAPRARDLARRLVAEGRRAMRDLLGALDVRLLPEREWSRVAPAEALMDVDTPGDLEAARRRAGG